MAICGAVIIAAAAFSPAAAVTCSSSKDMRYTGDIATNYTKVDQATCCSKCCTEAGQDVYSWSPSAGGSCFCAFLPWAHKGPSEGFHAGECPHAVVGALGEPSLAEVVLRRAAPATTSVSTPLDEVVLGKGCSFCIQANFNFVANFDKLSHAIAGIASELKDVKAGLEKMEADLSKELAAIAHGIEDLAESIGALGVTMLLHIVAMRGFLNQVKSEIDFGILVGELQTSIARIAHRQSLLDPLFINKNALSPEEKQELVSAIRDINEGSSLDTQIIHSAITADGAVLPGVRPALDIYIAKGYRLSDLAKTYAALLVYQFYGYGQLFWAEMNHQPNITLLEFNQTNITAPQRLDQQWRNFGSSILWGCYWDNGLHCPDRQECHAELRGAAGFTCNSATAPVVIDTNTGKGSGVNAFALGAASTDHQLEIEYNNKTGCKIGVRDCSGNISRPLWKNVTCTSSIQMHLTSSGLLDVYPGGPSKAPVTIVNVSAASKGTHAVLNYSLFVDELGAAHIEGQFANGTLAPLWSSLAPPPPASGSCPTNFTKRQLKAITEEGCHCITTSRWRRVALNQVNVTASWCARLCQSDSQYVVSSARANGECWCGTPDILVETKAANCPSTCAFCPGAPVEACGLENTVAMYSWAPGENRVDYSIVI